MSRSPFAFDRALVRAPAATVSDGLRVGDHEGPQYAEVMEQHRAYVAALEDAGLTVEQLPALDDYPDSVFVEDPAFVLGRLAVALRPGAPTRVGEAAEIAPDLRRRFDRTEAIGSGFVDGGDILVLPNRVMVGLSARTDRVGAAGFAALLEGAGETVQIVETPADVLHLKTGCALVDEETVLAIPELAASGLFDAFDVIVTPSAEEAAANALRINDHLLISASFERTAELLDSRGYEVRTVETEAIRKLDAGLSCMSLRWLSAG